LEEKWISKAKRLNDAQLNADKKRRDRHFQVRLEPDLAASLRHFMEKRDYNVNQALNVIISQFFRGNPHA
tara:strand:- start:22495 stop:22704 length:210 start_codon:yes stop_codon:yes gene_type:complete